jgi:hypothetical protein
VAILYTLINSRHSKKHTTSIFSGSEKKLP